jgi:nicotinamide-nucleotide amidase
VAIGGRCWARPTTGKGVGHAVEMLPAALTGPANHIAATLRDRGETIAVAEGSAGGLISASLLSVPGASAYYLGGAVIYTAAANRAFMSGPIEVPARLRGATEEFATYIAQSVAARLDATWGLGEAGAAGPPNRYGDPSGHCWVAVAGPTTATHHVLTGADDRQANMVAFAGVALQLLIEALESRAAL